MRLGLGLGIPTSSPASGFRMSAIPGLAFLYTNQDAIDGSMNSIVDRSSSGRNLSVDATVSRRPKGFPRNWSHAGNPVFSCAGFATQQYVQDQSGSALTNFQAIHQPGFWIAAKIQPFSDGQLFGNWGAGTSNENSLSLGSTAETLNFYLTTVPGNAFIAASTPVGWFRFGDRIMFFFRHNSDKTWTLRIVREPRYPGDAVTVHTASGSHAVTVSSAASTWPFTIGANPQLNVFSSVRTYALLGGAVTPTTTQDMLDLETSWSSLGIGSFLSWDRDDPIAETNLGDGKHGDVTYHSQVGAMIADLEQKVATALSISSADVALIGDSRLVGTGIAGITAGTNDMRTVAQSLSTFARTSVGPRDDTLGNAWSRHFSFSGAVTRSYSVQVGHSQRTPHAGSIDAFIGPGKSYNTPRILTWYLGVNDVDSSISHLDQDQVDEMVRIVEYVRTFKSPTTVGLALLNEPVVGSTTTGLAQRATRVRNYEYHGAVRYLRALGMAVKMGNLNKQTYNP